MKIEDYLKKHLQGYSEDGNYCHGKYVGCVSSLIDGYMAVTNCVFRRVSTHHRGTSKRLKRSETNFKNLWFSHMNSLVPIPFNGHLFEITGSEAWICSYGSDNRIIKTGGKRKRKPKKNIEEKCPASINIRTVKVYVNYTIRDTDNSQNDKRNQENMKQELLKQIRQNNEPSFETVSYCRFPLFAAHSTHDPLTMNVSNSRMDRRIANKIREFVRDGIRDVDSIRMLLLDFTRSTLFAHADPEELPNSLNTKYYPTRKMIQTHMAIATGSMKKDSGNSSMSIYSSPIVREMVMNRVPMQQTSATNSVGLIALHAGAGYHSEQRWPAYKLLCKQACAEAATCLKRNGSAGEAVMVAMKILEDSELTNAGYGSNLTECGDIECDASVMDASVSLDSQVKFGAVSGVSCIRNPICAAYQIAKQQCLLPTLSLGRVPPCSLCGVGAEKWSLAHGVEMCDKDSLANESSLKTWKKYHLKILQHLRNQEVEASSGDESLSTNQRFDTVGAIAIDVYGRVASGASSGGLLMKLPGRVGQAAMYGCGTWAENATELTPSVAVTSSGCGEQLMYTMLAKKCAENLQKMEEPCAALQHTLLEDFLGTGFLDSDCNRQAGLLALNQIRDGRNSTTEVVWGHTTNSMLIAHMSTKDVSAEVVLSRLPETAVSGKSVSVSGTWIKVSNPADEQPNTPNNAEGISANMGNVLEYQPVIDETIQPETNQDAPVEGCKMTKDLRITSQLDGTTDDFLLDSDITIMYLSTDVQGLTADRCSVRLSSEFDRKIDESFEKRILPNWEARCSKNPRFFNAYKFRIDSVEKSDEKLVFNLGLTCYRDYMETNWSSDVAQLHEMGETIHNHQQAFLSDPLGVAGILVTSDDLIVFQRRNHWVAEGAHQVDVPGGHPEPTEAARVSNTFTLDIKQLCPDDVIKEIFMSQLKEVRDELNVPIEHMSEPRILGLVRNKQSGGRPVCYFSIRCDLSSEKVQELYKKGGSETDESTELIFVPEQEVTYMERDSKDFWKDLCPNGKACVTLYSILRQLKNGEIPFQSRR